MLEDFDKQVSIFTESFARKLNRRKMVATTVKGLFATVAATTVGQLANFGQAFAVSCTCDEGWTTGHPCGYYGYKYRCPHNTSLTNGCHRLALSAQLTIALMVAGDGAPTPAVTGSRVVAWVRMARGTNCAGTAIALLDPVSINVRA